MVAGDRVGLFRRLDDPGLIDLGTWQTALRGAIADYLKLEVPPAANSQASERIYKNE
jgi:hypothetical protein